MILFFVHLPVCLPPPSLLVPLRGGCSQPRPWHPLPLLLRVVVRFAEIKCTVLWGNCRKFYWLVKPVFLYGLNFHERMLTWFLADSNRNSPVKSLTAYSARIQNISMYWVTAVCSHIHSHTRREETQPPCLKSSSVCGADTRSEFSQYFPGKV